jgi:rubrerythrin
MFTLTDIVEIALQIEKNGESTYRRAQRETSDPSLAELLGLLADEELAHQQWFEAFKGRVATQPVDAELEDVGRELFQNILGEKAFSLDDVDFSRIPDLQALLRISSEFEQDTIVFYEMLEPFVEDTRSQDDLRLIIEEEKEHFRNLQQRLENPFFVPIKSK